MNTSSSRSNSAADPADEATEAIDGLSIASPSVESIRGEETLDVNEAFAKWAWDISKYADKDFDKEVCMTPQETLQADQSAIRSEVDN